MKKNSIIFLLVIIIAVIWYFTQSNPSSSSSSSSKDYPLNLNKPLKFTYTKSNFGSSSGSSDQNYSNPPSSSDLYSSNPPSSSGERYYQSLNNQNYSNEPCSLKYSDGTTMSPEHCYSVYSKKEEKYPDGSDVTDNTKVNTIILGSKIPQNIENNKMNGFNKITTESEFNTWIDNATDDLIHYLTYTSLWGLIYFNGNITKMISYCANNSSSRDCGGYLPFVFVVKRFLNTDFLNDQPKIGNGWDQYPFSATITKDSDITPSGIIFGKKVKTVACVFRASETGVSNNNTGSQFTISINGNVSGPSVDTTWIDNRNGLHYNIYVVDPTKLSVVLNSLKINVTCPGSNVVIESGFLCIVYV
jgi:hypothetical protein